MNKANLTEAEAKIAVFCSVPGCDKLIKKDLATYVFGEPFCYMHAAEIEKGKTK